MVVLEPGPLGKEEKFTMRHIDDLTIHQFRGLHNVKFENLGQINLLVGENNSGKTSVLEALFLLADPLNWRRWSAIASSREMGISSSLSINERIAWLFPQQNLANDTSLLKSVSDIEISASGNISLEKVVAHYELLSEIMQVKIPVSGSDGESFYEEREKEVESIKVSISTFLRTAQKSLFGSTFDMNDEKQESFTFSGSRPVALSRKTSSAIIPAQLVNPSSHRLSSTPSLLWSEVVNSESKDEAIQLLQFFDSNIQDIDIILNSMERPTVSVKHLQLKRAPLSIFGDGLRRVFALAGAIPGAREGLLMVDELEMSVHTGALEKSFAWFFNACLQNDIQLFVTTHSLETIDTIIDVCSDKAFDLTAYRIKQENDQTLVTRLDKDLLKRLREDLGLEVR